jgi:4-carboxymuconolactone decarboxylase
MSKITNGQTGSSEPLRVRTARIPLLDFQDMSQEQREIYDSVTAGPRGRMVGPLLAAIHSPTLAKLWSRFGEYVRYHTCLPTHLSELAILVCGRRWSSQVEWWVHSRVALDAGISPSIIEAIRKGAAPQFESEAELEIYEYARHLQLTGQVPAALHKAIVDRWGVMGVVELTAVIGYYTLVAMTLNAHDIAVPAGEIEPLSCDGELARLEPGRLGR